MLESFGKAGVPVILVIGGLLATIFSKSVGAKYESLMSAAGFLAMGGGLALFVNTSAFSTAANVTFPTSTEIQTKMYANPVNNLSNIPKKNRFDLQTNYLIGQPNNNEEYMNNLILNEVKDMGLGASNYPVRMNPWEIKTLIPTTQVEPSRDFNTVKMVMT